MNIMFFYYYWVYMHINKYKVLNAHLLLYMHTGKCTLNLYLNDILFYFSVQRSDYLNTFEFLDKVAELLTKKQSS